MSVAQLGPITALVEAFATSVAAGMLLGSFAMGVVGLLVGWSRQTIEDRVLTDGYFGGIVGAAIAIADIALRYVA